MKIEISVRTAQMASIACNTVCEMIDQLPWKEIESLRKDGFLIACNELDEALKNLDEEQKMNA